MDEFFQDRDAFLDAVESQVDNVLDGVFLAFLAGMSDNPRDAVWDVLVLLLLDSAMPLINSLPFDSRARELAASVDLPFQGSSRRLGASRDALVEGLRARVANTAMTLAGKLQESAANAQFNGAVATARDFLEKSKDELVADFVGAVLQYERIVLDVLAELSTDQAEIVFIYAGPRDRKNREFCSKYAGRETSVAYTRDAIERLNDDPDLHKYVPPNVFTLCGGINCRHMFFPVKRSEYPNIKVITAT